MDTNKKGSTKEEKIKRYRETFYSVKPQKDRRKRDLPGYVSVTSKKEERRDT